jgi:catechol 2,3-dioxygenase
MMKLKPPLGWLFNACHMPENYTIPAGASIGHVHLKVSDLARAEAFYCGLLGFTVMVRYGADAVFISAGGYHHHIGLNTWYSKGAQPAPKRAPGLFHTAVLYPARRDLAFALRRLLDAGYPLTGASDHGVSEALYLDDPDGNGVELYWDRPREEWPHREDGSIDMYTEALDLEDLLRTLV